jgi:hypothetical protein
MVFCCSRTSALLVAGVARDNWRLSGATCECERAINRGIISGDFASMEANPGTRDATLGGLKAHKKVRGIKHMRRSDRARGATRGISAGGATESCRGRSLPTSWTSKDQCKIPTASRRFFSQFNEAAKK